MRPRASEFASASGRDGVHGRQVPPQALAPSLCRRRIALLLYKRSALITVPYSCFSAKQSSSTEQACSAEQSVWIRNRASCLNPRYSCYAMRSSFDFSITLSAVCLETATDELAGVAQPPHSHRVRARVVSTASFWGCVLWPLTQHAFSVAHGSACMGHASRRSPERLAGPRADLGRTWVTAHRNSAIACILYGIYRGPDAHSIFRVSTILYDQILIVHGISHVRYDAGSSGDALDSR